PEDGPLLRQPGHGRRADRPARRPGRRRLLRRVPLLHRAEQVRRPCVPLGREPGAGPALRPQRRPPRAGRRRRPHPGGRGGRAERADPRPRRPDRLPRPGLAGGAQPDALADARRSRRRHRAPGHGAGPGRASDDPRPRGPGEGGLAVSIAMVNRPPVAIYREDQWFSGWVYAALALIAGLALGAAVWSRDPAVPLWGSSSPRVLPLAVAFGLSLPPMLVVGLLRM